MKKNYYLLASDMLRVDSILAISLRYIISEDDNETTYSLFASPGLFHSTIKAMEDLYVLPVSTLNPLRTFKLRCQRNPKIK